MSDRNKSNVDHVSVDRYHQHARWYLTMVSNAPLFLLIMFIINDDLVDGIDRYHFVDYVYVDRYHQHVDDDYVDASTC
jgi:hypothetical protein